MNSQATPPAWVADIGGGYGIFAEELKKICPLPIHVIEPGPNLAAACRERGLSVIQAFLEELTPADLPPGPGLFCSFELFEHLNDPKAFLSHLSSLMRPGSLLVLSTLSGLGLDIQELGAHSKAIFPPHHLNFANPKSLKKLLEATGFHTVTVKTPGLLDLDILKNHLHQLKPGFWQTVLKTADAEDLATLQGAIMATGFSSHMWATAAYS